MLFARFYIGVLVLSEIIFITIDDFLIMIYRLFFQRS